MKYPEAKRLVVSSDVLLKEIRPEDATGIYNIIDRERDSLRRWLPFVDYTKTANDTAEFITSTLEPSCGNRECVFVIIYKGDTAGLIGFKGTDKANKRTEIGYWLSEQFRGKGVVTQSVRRLVKFAFEEMDINRIQIRCAIDNISSREIPERTGFKAEGVERDGELLSDGNFTDIQVYSLLKKDYPGL
jgi:ribosomal-protein-serine acetyltransferase